MVRACRARPDRHAALQLVGCQAATAISCDRCGLGLGRRVPMIISINVSMSASSSLPSSKLVDLVGEVVALRVGLRLVFAGPEY